MDVKFNTLYEVHHLFFLFDKSQLSLDETFNNFRFVFNFDQLEVSVLRKLAYFELYVLNLCFLSTHVFLVSFYYLISNFLLLFKRHQFFSSLCYFGSLSLDFLYPLSWYLILHMLYSKSGNNLILFCECLAILQILFFFSSLWY